MADGCSPTTPCYSTLGRLVHDARQTLRADIANLRRKIETAEGGRLIATDLGVGSRLADAHPEGARRGRRVDEAIDRKPARSRESALRDVAPKSWAAARGVASWTLLVVAASHDSVGQLGWGTHQNPTSRRA
jgi:hypothetical protein